MYGDENNDDLRFPLISINRQQSINHYTDAYARTCL